MIKHIVLFRFADTADPAERDSMLAELAEFPGRFPAMRNWTMGTNRSWRDDRFTHGFVVEFDREEELDAYLRSDEHESFVEHRFRPLVAERAIVSYAVQ